jgi:hypothetical protein
MSTPSGTAAGHRTLPCLLPQPGDGEALRLPVLTRCGHVLAGALPGRAGRLLHQESAIT